MKSFGVRLAAGAITILFGAYAAALAQKDKQYRTEPWTANAPSLSEPAVPIEGMSNGEWISEPADHVASGESTFALASYDSPNDDSSSISPDYGDSAHNAAADSPPSDSVALVQHTAPLEGPEPNAADAPTMELNAFPQPPSDGPATEAVADFAPDWSLPSSPPDDLGPNNADINMSAPPIATPTAALNEPSPSAASAPSNSLPEFQLGTPPINDVFPSDSQAASEPFASRGPGPEPSGAPTSDGNLLRAADAGLNMLREIPTAPSFDPNATPQSNDALAGQSPLAQFPRGDGQLMVGDPIAGQRYDGEQIAPTGGFDPPRFPAAGQINQPPNFNSAAQYAEPAQRPRGGLQPAPNQQFGQPPRPERYANNSQRYEPRYDQPPGNVSVDLSETIDEPGDRRLEGIQSPSVVIHKRAPSEVKVGKPATFVIHVQNVGSVEALDVQVHDKVPLGMRLVDASPAPMMRGANALLWQLGSMPAGDERTLTLQLVPEQEGELGSVARVSFEAAASVRTLSTRPELRVVQYAPETVMIGQQLEIELEISNPGSGAATNVVLQEDVPDGLEHPKGTRLDNAIGDLAPGEVRRQVLRLRAVAPGIIQNTIRLAADDNLVTDHTVAVQVVAPEIQVELAGPSRRFLERQASYQVNIGNVGTADATNVELAVQLDRGFTFVSTENEGQYDPSRHTVYWSLARLPAGGTGSVGLTLLPVEEGEQAIKLDARADLGVVAKNERRLSVEGFSELSFSITNPGGPIELFAETSYEIRVTNSGSKSDSNVQVQLELPPGLELLSSDPNAMSNQQGLVAFDPKSQLAPGSDVVYRVRVRGVTPGTHVVQAAVVSDQARTPVRKEESTLVYADQ